MPTEDNATHQTAITMATPGDGTSNRFSNKKRGAAAYANRGRDSSPTNEYSRSLDADRVLDPHLRVDRVDFPNDRDNNEYLAGLNKVSSTLIIKNRAQMVKKD